jgi:hypothetical protein
MDRRTDNPTMVARALVHWQRFGKPRECPDVICDQPAPAAASSRGSLLRSTNERANFTAAPNRAAKTCRRMRVFFRRERERFLVISSGTPTRRGAIVQVQLP